MEKVVLVINCGSSSLKFAVINPENKHLLASGIAERLTLPDATISFKFQGIKTEKEIPKADHKGAFFELVAALKEYQLIDGVIAVGHRVVHGGECFKASCIITSEVRQGIEGCCHLAPLHNPAHLIGIDTAMTSFPDVKHIAVFDTSFHQTMPAKAFRYPLPDRFYKEKQLRRYGMHGTSYRFVHQQAVECLGMKQDEGSFVIAHLGNGASAAAVLNGKSVDTTMGLTPLEGLMMGTRCGSIDPNIFSFLKQTYGYNLEEITKILNSESGLLGLSNITNDCRDIEEAVEAGDDQAKLTMDVFCYVAAKQLAGMAVALDKIDALVFTGGIGENSAFVRKKILQELAVFNFAEDERRNMECRFGKEGLITTDQSTKAIVIGTNEELMIAMDSAMLIKNS